MILVTGGTGYIGSHTVVELLAAGKDVPDPRQLRQQQPQSTGTHCRHQRAQAAFREATSGMWMGCARCLLHRIKAVIHFAGLKAVGESVEQPLTLLR